jgi:hypothetical protein
LESDYLTGKTDQGLYLSSFPSIYPKSFVQEMHLNCFAVSIASLSPYYYPNKVVTRELILFSKNIKAFLVYTLFAEELTELSNE